MTGLLLPTRPTFHANYNRARAKPKKDCGCGCNGRGDCGKTYKRRKSGLLEPVNRIWTPERKPAHQPWKTRGLREIYNRRKTPCCCVEETSSTASSEDTGGDTGGDEESDFSGSTTQDAGCECSEEQWGAIIPSAVVVTFQPGGAFGTCCDPIFDASFMLTYNGDCSWGNTFDDPCTQVNFALINLNISALGTPLQYVVTVNIGWKSISPSTINYADDGFGNCFTGGMLPFSGFSGPEPCAGAGVVDTTASVSF